MTKREIAREAANNIADNHRGAWGGVMLQVDWMTDVIELAMDQAIADAKDVYPGHGEMGG